MLSRERAADLEAVKAAEAPLLDIRGLKTHFATDDGIVQAVDGVDITVGRGETVCVVGESGCGKTVTALSVLKLIAMPPGRIAAGQILWQGRDIVPLPPEEMNRIRAREIAIVFQEPMTSLNPVYTIGDQISSAVRAHGGAGRHEAWERAYAMLDLVQIPSPRQRARDYPHQLSGGLRQRAMIAMALASGPALLIADEPTTALDVTIQAQILDLMRDLQKEFGMSIMMITHDLGVVADIADEIVVMYAGRVVERAATRELFYDPQHPYAWGLLGSIPRLDRVKSDRLHSITGTPPSLIQLPQGCKFRPRCPHAFEKCLKEPELENRVEVPGHVDRCWLDVETKRSVRDATISGDQPEAA
jgi:peptide/nickel transport system ATP-binding protein